MKEIQQSFSEIRMQHKVLFVLMLILFVASGFLFINSLTTLSPSSAVVKVGYSDIGSFQGGDFSEMQLAGGYRDGSWTTRFGFTIFAIITGVMHNFIAVKLYKRRGKGIAGAFVGVSIGLVICCFIVLFRLLGEG